MGKIAAIEDVEGIRDEQDIRDEPLPEVEHTEMRPEESSDEYKEAAPSLQIKSGRYISTLVEVQDAFEYLNTLRYSQPTHLQGTYFVLGLHVGNQHSNFDNRKVSRHHHHTL